MAFETDCGASTVLGVLCEASTAVTGFPGAVGGSFTARRSGTFRQH
jgi:hypothetical protein